MNLFFNSKKQSQLKINSDAFNLTINGNFLETNYDKPIFNKILSKFQGNLTAEIVNFKNFYQLLKFIFIQFSPFSFNFFLVYKN